MRGNLIPIQIVNKNGVTTTVHKKAGSANNSNASGIPPASLPKRTPAPKKLSGLAILETSSSRTGKYLSRMFTTNKKPVGKRVQDAMVAEIHEDTFSILDELDPRTTSGVVSQVFHTSVLSKSFVHLNNLAVVSDVLNEYSDTLHANVFHTYIHGLQMYRLQSDPLTDWSSKSAEEQEVPKALIRAAIGLKKPYSQVDVYVEGGPRHITYELAELVMKRPHDVQRIISLVNDRDLPVDTEQGIVTLEGLLDQESNNTLLDGVL